MRAITISVDFGDILAITLPYNRHHFNEVWVITTPSDHQTMRVANQHRAHVLTTDLFYANGAAFNKYLALEWGLDVIGRHGWLVIMDADCMWPANVPCDEIAGRVPSWYPVAGNLYTPQRRIWADVTKPVPAENEWGRLPYHHYQREWSGYTQIFHARDPHLGPAPWHQVDWRHAGGGDSFFQALWPAECRLRPPWEVLCLGPDDARNWLGRTMPYTDGRLPAESEKRGDRLREMLAARRLRKPENRFAGERIET